MSKPDPDRDHSDADLLADTTWVRSLILRLGGNDDDANDVIQDLWVALLSPRQRSVKNRRTWIRSMARNVFRKRQRSESRRRRHEHRAASPEAQDDVDPAHIVDYAWLAEQVLELPEPYRSTVRLRYYNGLDLSQIAHRHAVSIEAVRTRLRRARLRLRAVIARRRERDGRGWTPAVSSLAATLVRWPWTRTAIPVASAALVATFATIVLTADGTPVDPLREAPATRYTEVTLAPPHPAARPAGAEVTSPLRPAPTTRVADRALPRARPGLCGRVEDENGRAVAGALVSVYPPPGPLGPSPSRLASCQSIRTDEQGRFRFEMPARPPGAAVFLRASYPGLASVAKTVTSMNPIALRLPVAGRLTGRVLDASSGKPIAKAMISLFGRDGYRSIRVGFGPNGTRHFGVENHTHHTRTTGPDGRYGFDDLAPGPYYVVIWSRQNSLPHSHRALIHVKSNASETRDFVMPPVGEGFIGRVIDRQTRSPIKGATVRLLTNDRLGTRTGSDGRFLLPVIGGRAFDVRVRVPGYVACERSVAPPIADVLFELDRPGRVAGRIVDLCGGPIAGASVATTPRATRVDGLSPRASTGEDGTFSLDGVSPGRNVRIYATAPNRAGAAGAPFALDAGGRREDVTIRLGPGGSIDGRVLTDGAPTVVHVALRTTGAAGSFDFRNAEFVAPTRADSSGRFRFDHVPSGAYLFAAWMDRTFHVFGDVAVVRSGETSVVTLEAPRPREVVGTVTNARGAPVREAKISIRGNDDDFAFTDHQGRFHLFAVAAGAKRICIEHDLHQSLERVVRTGAEVSIILTRKRSLEGHVRHVRTKRPPLLFWVRLCPQASGRHDELIAARRFFCGTDGHFSVSQVANARVGDPPLPEGPFCLQAGTNDGLVSRPVPRLTFTGDRRSLHGLELLLERGGSLRGVVVNQRGRPVPRMSVCARALGAVCPSFRIVTRTDNRGRFLFSSMYPGDYAVIAGGGDGANARETVRILPDERRRVRLVLHSRH